MIATATAPSCPLGSAIPAMVPHAISVSLPTWQDVIGYEEGEKRVVETMQTGYPRFFVHRSIQKLAGICLQKFGLPDELCTLLPTPKVAQAARSFLLSREPPAPSRIVEFVICPSTASLVQPGEEDAVGGVDCIELQILLYNKQFQPVAKQFWQHSGDGISSRTAERGLAFLGEGPAGPLGPPAPVEKEVLENTNNGSADDPSVSPTSSSAILPGTGKQSYSRNRHYSRSKSALPLALSRPASTSGTTRTGTTSLTPSTPITPGVAPNSASSTTGSARRPNAKDDDLAEDLDDLSLDHSTFLEERYGRNLPLASSKLAKLALRRRIAGTLLPHEKPAKSGAGALNEVPRGSGMSDGKVIDSGNKVDEDDVYLYPTGMSAIWHAHQLAMAWKERKDGAPGKSVCFGFPYTDTLKILQKWGPGCHFFGHGTTPDLHALSDLLDNIRASKGTPEEQHPITALFCEFPSNPLLRSADLKELRRLADEHEFVIVVDETVGNFVNVEVASWTDIVVSSLTKVFSGETNVMGGSLVLTPHSKFYADLKSTQEDRYEDHYFPEDAIYMERNSRDFRHRISIINDNAYDLTELLVSKSQMDATSSSNSVLKRVYYPRYVTPENYGIAQRLPTTGKGGYGGLFSLTFTTQEASKAFFDALECHKGPSLGTNFTLACPYTLLAHYLELDWANDFGVESGLVRVSVGLEEIEGLKAAFLRALDAAQKTVKAD
ncbi:putative cystathionine gamma-synthase [Filobasidium floriforme]|uniref:putative cystathionine gamma-synthase n=1 Tax=Filobasidium floriforme TaxID=5210 RepID=UPI001E8DD2F1|nr:putative cystathionine gamma-synthase [Filobasidium floriforme]KAH8090464.1 putative cystathionine gamma-synthase [Filobasidium floriforme]